MTPFDSLQFDRNQAMSELAAFQALWGPETREVRERQEILPFFKSNRHLAGMIGQFNPGLRRPTHVKTEMGFFGDHACDLAIGEATTSQFCFVEFEDARLDSIFRLSKHARPAWAPRLQHGFDQILDWFRLLDDMKNTERFRSLFGSALADYTGLLVIWTRWISERGTTLAFPLAF